MANILILGGTSDARRIAEHLATRPEHTVRLSLAGRTTAPAALPVPVRVGGYGGAEGLAAYLKAEQIDTLIDATHPYAAVMSTNAAWAAQAVGVRLVALRRPAWAQVEGDQWIEVDGVGEAVEALGASPRRVFLALGRKDIAAFAQAPQHHYLVRSVDPIDPPLAVPHADYIRARGPFSEENDRALLTRHRIDIVVAKNSGGSATYGKIAAARSLALPVVILRRPPVPPDVPTVETVDEAITLLDHAPAPQAERGV
ncbi:MAG: cobalt-precorrin-6A reductase [Xanthobacteraceae bacterium]